MRNADFGIGEKYFGIDYPSAVVFVTIMGRHDNMISYSIDDHPGVAKAKIYEGMGGKRIYVQTENRVSVDAKNKISSFDKFLINGSVLKIGQRVMLNCGTPFPLRYGEVSLFSEDGSIAIIQLDKTDHDSIGYCTYETNNLHRQSWQSPNGSPLGMFIVDED